MPMTCPVCEQQMRYYGRTFQCRPCRQFIILLRHTAAHTAKHFGSTQSTTAKPTFWEPGDGSDLSEHSHRNAGRRRCRPSSNVRVSLCLFGDSSSCSTCRDFACRRKSTHSTDARTHCNAVRLTFCNDPIRTFAL